VLQETHDREECHRRANVDPFVEPKQRRSSRASAARRHWRSWRVHRCAASFADAAARIAETPGIGRVAAAIILAEIGAGTTRFPTAGHLASRAKFAPGVSESAGKKKGRIARRRGTKKAIVAVGRSILVITWHLLSDPDAPLHRPRRRVLRPAHSPRPQEALRHPPARGLGYKVTLEPAA
jgi:transposase